ncbi:MAG: hypothetical protein ABR591_14890 [Candidatus Velthaea sp.]
MATVVAGTMRTPLDGLPRVLITRYARGQNFGPPGDTAEHAELARAALALFDATEPALLDHKAALRA